MRRAAAENMKTIKADKIIDAHASHGESAFWDQNRERVVFCDCEKPQLWTYEDGERGPVIKRHELQFIPRAVLWSPSGGYFGISHHTVYRINEDFQIMEVFREFDFTKTHEIFNDCRVGPDGGLYLGTFGAGKQDHFYHLSMDGCVTVLLENVACSNGFAWTNDLKILYYTDSVHRIIYSFDFSIIGGIPVLSGRKNVLYIEEGLPDGFCIDSDGNLWIAVWGGGCILKADPRTGSILEKLPVASRCPSSCVFGGVEMKDLFITTSRQWIKEGTEVPDGDCSGDMFVIRDAVTGKRRKNDHTKN